MLLESYSAIAVTQIQQCLYCERRTVTSSSEKFPIFKWKSVKIHEELFQNTSLANVFFPSYAKEKAKNGDPKLSSRSLLQHKRRAVENLIQSISPNLVEDARASLANKILNELC